MVESVNFYLAWFAERGKDAEKPFSGKLMVRTTPEIQSRAAIENNGRHIPKVKQIKHRPNCCKHRAGPLSKRKLEYRLITLAESCFALHFGFGDTKAES